MGSPKIESLEAVRGLAALAVVASHCQFAFWPRLEHGPAPWDVWHDGAFAVRLFFVLSGFVLSLSYFRSRSPAVLPSAAARRYWRLFFPVAASVALSFALLSAGLYRNQEAARLLGYGQDDWLTIQVRFPPSAAGALREAAWDSFFGHDSDRTYNAALWTMGVEFSGSLLVFALLALAGGLRGPARAAAYSLTIAVLAGRGQFFLADFVLGVALADLATSLSVPAPFGLWPAAALAGLCLGGLRREWLSLWGLGSLPGVGHFPAAGAVLVVAGAVFSPGLRGALSRRPFAWLGALSFPLYLFHLPVLLSLGCGVYLLAAGSGVRHDIAALSASAATASASLLLSHVAALTVEPFSIRFGRRFWAFVRLRPETTPSP